MRRARSTAAALVALTMSLLAGRSGVAAPPSGWPGEELPLPLTVKTAQDLALKTEAERLYALFNLLAGGKLAFDAGEFAKAVKKWEALLRLPDVTPAVEKAVKPLLAEAQRAARDVAVLPLADADGLTDIAPAATAPVVTEAAPVARTVVSGQATGGGDLGPGGAVLWLKRADGPTPRPRPGKRRAISQKNKLFVPRVLAVTVGTTVDFRNDDDFFHNVFSLNQNARFDTGLYQAGGVYSRAFPKPGAVQLLCNIHASMVGYVYVVDSPYYTQANGNGAFTIKNVPPGEYELLAWHETSTTVVRKRMTVGASGVSGVAVTLPADKRPETFVPDKYGKPRQPNLGY